MTLLACSIAALALSSFSAVLFVINLFFFKRLPLRAGRSLPAVSVLIPARNEEQSIVAAVESVLANVAALEVIVLDDHSSDDTAARVVELSRRDSRVRLERSPPLPSNWCGKQHACQVLAGLAQSDLLLWIDADVRLAPDAAGRLAAWMDDHPTVGLLSGFPHQETGTSLERLLIPLMHFILLGFLPIPGMRKNVKPSLGAGCGQLFLARRQEYERAGGHASIRSSLHDGIMLPRAFRNAGILTDIFDATDVAQCRMYRSGRETWAGLAKNATEGLAAPLAIYVWTMLLTVGQVLPLVILLTAPSLRSPPAIIAAIALLLSITVRLIAAVRFLQPLAIALLHPLAITCLLAIQWHAWGRRRLGISSGWKGRAYPAH